MSVRSAHGVNIDEISKYDAIFSQTDFSLAVAEKESDIEKLKPFYHAHEEYEFILPLTTIPLLKYNRANYIGEVGYVYPVNPMTEHGIEYPLKSKVISITVTKEYIERIKFHFNMQGRFFYTRFPYNKVLLNLIEEYKKNTDKNIADKIVKHLVYEGLKSDIDNVRPAKEYNPHIKEALEYMWLHRSEEKTTIALIAKQSGYSLSYFTKAFKAYMHDTPIMHLNKLRISDAKSYMFFSNLPLKDIALKCGYKNFSTFTEAFKVVQRMTPSKYKKKYCVLE